MSATRGRSAKIRDPSVTTGTHVALRKGPPSFPRSLAAPVKRDCFANYDATVRVMAQQAARDVLANFTTVARTAQRSYGATTRLGSRSGACPLAKRRMFESVVLAMAFSASWVRKP